MKNNDILDFIQESHESYLTHNLQTDIIFMAIEYREEFLKYCGIGNTEEDSKVLSGILSGIPLKFFHNISEVGYYHTDFRERYGRVPNLILIEVPRRAA